MKVHDPIAAEQISFCAKKGVEYFPAPLDSKVGFALKTQDELPINGLRHPPENDTNGWYIWGGKTLPTENDFFFPLHTRHLLNRRPEIVKFLGLPPGYRFLVAGDFVDVWFDETLLDLKST